MVKEQGCLYLVGTPIGNLEDLTFRAVRILGEADVIACEDTRETLKLLNHLGLKKKLVSYEKYSEQEKKHQLLDLVESGLKVALVSDAGMPGISDPGEILVREAYNRGMKPVVIPGPSAAIAGLVLSGLPTANFYFQGFLPKGREKERREVLESLRDIPGTLIFYVSPHSLVKDLTLIRKVLGERNAALGRELTKYYEEVISGTLDGLLIRSMEKPLKGEMVLILEGFKGKREEPNLEEQLRLYEALMVEDEMSHKEALRTMVREHGVSKNRLYEYILQNKEKK